MLDWSLANYLLLKGDRGYLAIVSENQYGPGFQEIFLTCIPRLASRSPILRP